VKLNLKGHGNLYKECKTERALQLRRTIARARLFAKRSEQARKISTLGSEKEQWTATHNLSKGRKWRERERSIFILSKNNMILTYLISQLKKASKII
jgi:hypothetical protein